MTSYILRALLVSTVFAALSVTSAVGSERRDPDWLPSCGGTYDLCGFVDRDRREVHIPRQFERVFTFSEGLAGVRIEGKYGYIDRTGKVVIEPKFDLVGPFRNGHAEALVGEYVGVIDRSGSFILPPEYARAIPFGKTAVLVQPGAWKSRVRTGSERLETDLLILDERPFALLDLATRTTLEKGLHIEKFDFETFVWARRSPKSEFGLLAPAGTWKIQPTYSQVGSLWNKRASVCRSDDKGRGSARSSDLCSALDENGEQTLPMVPYRIGMYRNGLYSVMGPNKKMGLLNEAGDLIGGRLFEMLKFDEPGPVVAVRENGVWVGMTRDGQMVENPENGKVLLTCPFGLQFRARDGGAEIFKDGKPTTPYVFDRSYYDRDCNFPKWVNLKGKQSFIDADGRLLFDPPYFESTYSFIQGHAGVRANGKWGIIDTSGRFTVAPQYDALSPDEEGVFAVTIGNEKFWVDGRGGRVPKPVMTRERRSALTCREDGGSIIGKAVDGQIRWGLADVDGRILIEPKYRAITCFEAGLAWVPFDDRKQWCPIDRNEQIRADIPCETNLWRMGRTHSVRERMSDDPYESSVLWMRANHDYGLGVRQEPPRYLRVD